MNCKKLAQMLFDTAVRLDPSIKNASSKYPKDLGNWGLDESKLDELRRHLSKLVIELKVYDIDDREFPSFKGKNLVELEVKSDAASAKKAVDVLKRIKAFPIEKYHVVNLRTKKEEKE
jgi:hypothetical protein